MNLELFLEFDSAWPDSAVLRLKQSIAVQDCLPQKVAGGFMSEQERSDVVHDLLAFLVKQTPLMNR